MKPTSGRDERIGFSLSAEEVRSVDDFRFVNRMPNRASAVREILRRALRLDTQREDDTEDDGRSLRQPSRH